jgi:tetratricopeptide (TPR) repeat protein
MVSKDELEEYEQDYLKRLDGNNKKTEGVTEDASENTIENTSEETSAKKWYSNEGYAVMAKNDHKTGMQCYHESLDCEKEWEQIEKMEEATEYFDMAIKHNPKHAESWYWKAKALEDMERYEECIAWIDKALELPPELYKFKLKKGYTLDGYGNMWMIKCSVLSYLGRDEESKECGKKWEKLRDEEYAANDILIEKINDLIGKGEEFFNQKKFYKSLDCFNAALEVESYHEGSLAWKLTTLMKLEAHDESLKCLDKLLEINSDHAGYWQAKGWVHFNLKNYREAIRCADMQFEKDPNSYQALENKATALKELGCDDEAEQCIEEAKEVRTKVFYDEYQ